ncbi:hypothetical protein PQX77_007798 [Marasmius sp. AFHP31]|nr:hypothetical protein PQX77_007798 [Marasmius sp. AFHP31]
MGLSGRKVKQRIGADPRNLTWADDASKFGATYLAKFGWTSSQGLGVEGEGRTSHIKVSQKLDMLGIGAAQSKDPNGIAWKQNKDFENLLKRLNADNETSQVSDLEDESEKEAEQKEGKKEKKEKKKRKREEEEDKEKKKKRKKSDAAEDTKSEAPTKESSAPVVPRHRAHRARHIAAKSFASKSALAISEILGIASTPSSSQTTTVATPTGTLTPIDSEPPLEKLTTSTKSVSDYFKERLLAKSSSRSTPAQAVLTLDTDEPRGGLGSSRINNVDSEDGQDDLPRGGLGASRALAISSGLATSQITTTSKFASMFASFTPATTSTTRDPEPAVSNTQNEEDVELVEKKKRKEEKKKAKRRKEDLELEGQDTPNEDERAEKKRRKEERQKAKEDHTATVAAVDDEREKEEKRRKKKEKKEKRKEAEAKS